MKQAIAETARRRSIQAEFNERHGIVPTSIKKDVPLLDYVQVYAEPEQLVLAAESPADYDKDEAVEQLIHRLEIEMKAAAKELEFERAASLRNRIRALKLRELEMKSER
jgi:excinuclease ABC subunit B